MKSEAEKDTQFEIFCKESWPLWSGGMDIDKIAIQMNVNANAVVAAIDWMQRAMGTYRGGYPYSSKEAEQDAAKNWDEPLPWE